MDLSNLNQDRFLRKDVNQNGQTKGPIYSALNPVPKRGDDYLRKIGRPKGSEEDGGTPNVLTGTVITSCFIQTSALPSRIEMQGNNLTFFDDTYTDNGEVKGDTSQIFFTHDSRNSEGFIIEKRASTLDTFDNVLSVYALPPRQSNMNIMSFGSEGSRTHQQTNYIEFTINHTNLPVSNNSANGVFFISGVSDGAAPTEANFEVVHNDLINVSDTGYSVLMKGTSGGIIGFGSDIVPLSNGAYDIGTPSLKIGTFYGSVSACPLPTIENALEMLEQIPEPTFVGERGHYGLDRKYFDDLTFPPELLYTNSKGRTDIEHNHLLGFLLKVVKEQNEVIKDLSSRVKTLEEN